MGTHQSLNHQHPPPAQARQELIHVDRLLSLDPLQHGVQEHEGPGPTDPCTAVDQERHSVLLVVGLLDPADEGDEGSGKLGDSVIGPGGEVVLSQCQRLLVRCCSLWTVCVWVGVGAEVFEGNESEDRKTVNKQRSTASLVTKHTVGKRCALQGTHVLGIECSDLKVSERHGAGGCDLHLLVLSLKHVSNVVCPVLLTLALRDEEEWGGRGMMQAKSHNTIGGYTNKNSG